MSLSSCTTTSLCCSRCSNSFCLSSLCLSLSLFQICKDTRKLAHLQLKQAFFTITRIVNILKSPQHQNSEAMVGFADYENHWYEREAENLSTCGKWRRGRKYLFDLDHKYNQFDFIKRITSERKQRNYYKETDVVRDQANYLERFVWNHKFPNMANYRELHMHSKIVL